jgi:UDP-2,3-diacylglucosamine pyrophosphatase LpxH
LSRWIKLKVKNAVNFIGEFEQTLSGEARRHHVDGVICGHIHHPVIRMLDGLTYVNCGDWVESCTAAVEHFNGQLEIIEWVQNGPTPRLPDNAQQLLPLAGAADSQRSPESIQFG